MYVTKLIGQMFVTEQIGQIKLEHIFRGANFGGIFRNMQHIVSWTRHLYDEQTNA